MALEAPNVDPYRLLVEQVIAGHGLAGVIRLLAEMLVLPATIANDELEPLHAFDPRGQQLPPADGALPPDVRTRVSFDLTGEPQASTAPPTLCLLGEDGGAYALAPVVLPAGVLAYLWVVNPSGGISSVTCDVVSHAAAACTVEMMRQRAIIEGESRVRSSFLEDLLTGAVSSVNSTLRRARFLGYDLRGEQVVFALDLDRFSSYIEERSIDESGIQQLKERFRRGLDASIPAIWTRTLIWEHSDSLIVLAPGGKLQNVHTVWERVELLRSKVEARLEGPTVSAGIGRVYTDLTKLQDSYREAEHALTIGAAVHGGSATSAFEELGVYRLLYHLRDHPELAIFCEESLGALQRYDAEHGTALVDTLGTFLELQSNLSRTARALHLHRNGLLYRLSRIETIARCDLSNPTQRISLQLAFLARPLVRREKMGKIGREPQKGSTGP